MRLHRSAALLVAAAFMVATPAPGSAADPGTAVSVGANGFGQLGNGTTTASRTPVDVMVSMPVAVASGRDTAYALAADGRVWAWGNNAKGSVGDGTLTHRQKPVALTLTDVVEVEAGHYHGLALTSGGKVWAWGFGRLGQIGDGGTLNRKTPVEVVSLADKGIVHVAAGRDASYAVSSDGKVWAWGNNVLGEIGDGTSSRRVRPVQVPGLSDVVELGVGRNHVLARTSSGAVWAWGDDQYGQVGDDDGATSTQRSPVRLALSGIAHVDAGAHHSLAVTTSGEVLSWGRGYRGQLGHGGTASRSTPAKVGGLPLIADVGDGRDQSFAMTADGNLWAWGSNTNGQLGDGSTTRQTRPVDTGLTGVTVAQGGSEHTIFFRP